MFKFSEILCLVHYFVRKVIKNAQNNEDIILINCIFEVRINVNK